MRKDEWAILTHRVTEEGSRRDIKGPSGIPQSKTTIVSLGNSLVPASGLAVVGFFVGRGPASSVSERLWRSILKLSFLASTMEVHLFHALSPASQRRQVALYADWQMIC